MIADEDRDVPLLGHFDTQEVLDALSPGIVVLDGQLCAVYANPRAERLLAVRFDEARGRPLLDVLREPRSLVQTVRRALEDRQCGSGAGLADASAQLSVSDSAIRVRIAPLHNKMTGTHVLLELHCLEDGEKQDRQRCCGEVDVTLAHADRIAALGQMSASIVHEINQPIAAVVTSAQAALRFLECPNPNLAEVRQALTRIARLGNRIAEVVGHTRALVQRVAPRKSEFEISEAIREIISLSEEELDTNAVSVHTRFAQGLPLLRADRVLLQQVIRNLITNAVEAMSAVPARARELRISTGRTHTGDILVAVQDSGPGLEAQNAARVFDAFYSTKPRGLGIGLTICRSIIEAHEGRLWADLSGLRGATFQFTLPVHTGGAWPECDRIPPAGIRSD